MVKSVIIAICVKNTVYYITLQTAGFRSFTFTVMKRGEGEAVEVASWFECVRCGLAVGARAAGEFTSKRH